MSTSSPAPERLSFPDGWQGWHHPSDKDDPKYDGMVWRLTAGFPGSVAWSEHDDVAGAYLLERMRQLRSDPVADPRQWSWRISHAAGHLLLMRPDVAGGLRLDLAQVHPVIFGMGWTYAYVQPNGDPWPVDRIELYRVSQGVGSIA